MLTKLKYNQGVSLVEVMISLVIMLIVFLGLVQAAFLSINYNMRNTLRDEAVAITADTASRLRSTNFDDMNADGTLEGTLATTPALTFTSIAGNSLNQTRSYRAAVSVPFTVSVTVLNLDGTVAVPTENKRITITTQWTWQPSPGDPIPNFTHQIMTTRRR